MKISGIINFSKRGIQKINSKAVGNVSKTEKVKAKLACRLYEIRKDSFEFNRADIVSIVNTPKQAKYAVKMAKSKLQHLGRSLDSFDDWEIERLIPYVDTSVKFKLVKIMADAGISGPKLVKIANSADTSMKARINCFKQE